MEWLIGIIAVGAVLVWAAWGDPSAGDGTYHGVQPGNGFLDDDDWMQARTASLFDDDDWPSSMFDEPSINPVNGLPMVGCLDIEGNPYGTDSSHIGDDNWTSSSMDLFSDGFGMSHHSDDSLSCSSGDLYSAGSCFSDDWPF